VLFSKTSSPSSAHCRCQWEYLATILYANQSVFFKGIPSILPWKLLLAPSTRYRMQISLANKYFTFGSHEKKMINHCIVLKGKKVKKGSFFVEMRE
jgi:hypothetical protein